MEVKRLVLLTKQYPYGLRETYVDTEIPYLTQVFDEVILVPYDQYDYDPTNHRVRNEWDKVRVIQVNAPDQQRPISKLKREVRILRMWANEVLTGRDKERHILRWRLCLSRLRQCYAQSKVLENLAQQEGWTSNNTVLYNYWLHFGVLTGQFLREHTSQAYPMVSRAHALDMFHSDWPFEGHFLPFESAKIKACNTVYAASDHGRRFFESTFPKWKDTFKLQVLGVFDQGARDSSPGEVFTLCSATSISHMKRLDLVIEIMARLPFPVRWIHFGNHKEESLAKLQAAIDRHNMQDRVELRGLTPHEEIMDTYAHQHIDLYMNVSSGETIPVAVMEPASFGIPVFGTAVFGTPELVDDQVGLLVEVDFDLDQAAQAITALRNNPTHLLQLGNNARERVMTQFNADTNLRNFSEILMGYLRP